jgi:TP901 family phage tail tape measure protein
MALNKKVAIEVEIKNIKKVADLKKELKGLRKEQIEAEKYSKTGMFTSKKQEKQYLENARAIKKKSTELRNLNKNLRDSTTNTTKSTKATNGMAKQIIKGAAAIGVIVTAFRTINRAVSSVVTTFTEFEFVMAKVNAISGATEQEFAALTSSAEELGRTTFFTAEQVGQLQLNFSKLGFSAEEIMQAQKATLDLATATGSDLARSATVAASAVRGFGLDASETQRVVDVMAVSFSTSALDIEKFQTSMTKVAPIAKAAGFSIEDTTTIMAKLSDAGIEASIAGTSLRNILLKMQDPSSDLSKSFGGTIHSLDELIPAMRQFSLEGGDMASVMEVVDLRQAAAFELMLANVDILTDYRNSLKDSGGEAARMAEIVGNTLQGAFLKLKSALQGLSISIMKDFAAGLQRTGERLATFGNFLSDNSETITGLIKAVTTLIRVVGLYKIGVIAATKATRALRISKVLLHKTNKILAVSTFTLSGAIKALTLSVKGLLGSTGIGLLLAFAPEILNFFGLWNTKSEDVAEATKDIADEKSRLIGLLQQEIANTKVVSDFNIKTYKKEIVALEAKIARHQAEMDAQGEFDIDRSRYHKNEMARAQETINTLNSMIGLEEKYQGKRKKQEDEEIAQANDLLNIQKKLLEEAQNKPAVTEAAMAAKNAEIQQIQEEITRLGNLGKTKKEVFDLDRELLAFRVGQMAAGLTTELENAEIRRQVIQQEIKDLKDLIKTNGTLAKDKEENLKKLNDLEKKLNKDNQKDKDEAFKADVKRAILSGQTAEEAMKSVVRAQIMEAVAGFIASIFKNVPFPLNLVLAAGASAAVGKLIDNQLNRFEKGGVVEAYANGGMVQGKSHAQGGEKFAVGGRVVELEGGEAVINKRSTSMFKGQLSAMNAAGGGVKFADGGLMNMPSFASSQFNAIGQQNMMGAMNQSSRVVVVEADITNSQNTVGLIEAEATF